MKTSNFVRNPLRELPDGRIIRVYPFHISLHGHEVRVLFRDDEDYDTFVKILAVCSIRKNAILVAYGVVSNHGHVVILAESLYASDVYGEEVKRMYSQYYSRKYNDRKAMHGLDVNSQWLDSDWYLRNAIVYDILNAFDNCAYSLEDYPWTSYSAYFKGSNPLGMRVSNLTKREKRRVMHTDDNLSKVRWLLDKEERLIPCTICDNKYVEGAFDNTPETLLRRLGVINKAEISRRLVENPRTFRKDEEVLKNVADVSQRWFNSEIKNLPFEKKARLLSSYYRSNKTSVSQMARVIELTREEVEYILRKNGINP